jgi:cytochrome oxidase Cu insertion factor (SCO1/SenC/PrrC family)
MNLKHRFLLPTLALALAPVLSIDATALAVTPAGMNAGKIPDIAVWDEANVQHSLWDELHAAGSGPVIVLPVYTRCTMSCPVLARMLVQQTSQINGGTPYRVLIFSFDPGDDAQALRRFRAQKNLPSPWILVRSGAADIRRFCDFFHYTVMTEGPVMIHTNQMFLLDHNLQWRATFIDQSWNAADLRTWMSRAESPGPFGWLAMNPEVLVFAGFGGLLLSLMLILGIFILRPRSLSRQAAAVIGR